MKLTERDFVGPFPAHAKPARSGRYWSSPSTTKGSTQEIFKFGEYQKTVFKKGKWQFADVGPCHYQDRQWIGLTAEAANRVARELKQWDGQARNIEFTGCQVCAI